MDERTHDGLRRRDALIVIGGAGLTAALAGLRLPSGALVASSSCVALDAEVTEGPYWIANNLTRRNITEGLPGVPLRLHLTVIDVDTCKPIKGADVEVWHANATGVYSGETATTTTKRFLRGHQKANSSGVVIFDTIYPGWYRGRTPHIHLKVHVGGSVVHTGQLFFRDAISDAVYRTSAYKSRGEPDTTNAHDSIYAQAGGSSAQLHLSAHTFRSGSHGYIGASTLGVRT
jgi:protocatechuate 3,4-dioxygenase beta subunit